MPKRKGYRGRKRGRRVGRKKARRSRAVYSKAFRSRFGRPTATKVRGTGMGFAEQLRVKLVYEGLYQVTSTTGATVSWIFRGNDCNDPDYTGTGQQPLWYDQYAAIYETYRVHGSSIRVEALQPMGAGGGNNYIDLYVIPSKSSSTFGASNADWVAEQPYASRRTFNIKGYLKKYMGAAKLWGDGRRRIANATEYSGGTSGSPTVANAFYWHVVANSADRSTTITNLMFRVRLVYYVTFTGRLRVAQS